MVSAASCPVPWVGELPSPQLWKRHDGVLPQRSGGQARALCGHSRVGGMCLCHPTAALGPRHGVPCPFQPREAQACRPPTQLILKC